MAETPIIDAAIRAGCDATGGPTCTMPGCAKDGSGCDAPLLVRSALRAALPFSSSDTAKLDRYNRLMRELYPERFRA
jgi:hypothetical protein